MRAATGGWVTSPHRAIQLFERDHYADFVTSSLPELLEKAGLQFELEKRGVFGVARVVRAHKP